MKVRLVMFEVLCGSNLGSPFKDEGRQACALAVVVSELGALCERLRRGRNGNGFRGVGLVGVERAGHPVRLFYGYEGRSLLAQASVADGQRVRNVHPEGGSAALGGDPSGGCVPEWILGPMPEGLGCRDAADC